MSIFKGVGVALVTPMTEDGINFEEYGKLIDHVIDGGVDAVIVGGTTGEPSTMTEEERIEMFRYAVKKVNHRVPVIIGSGSNNTVSAVKMSKIAEAEGADGLLVVTPYYNKCTQNGLIAHYTAIADAVNIPIMLYNVPTRTGFRIAPATAVKLSEHKNIVAIKDASENIDDLLAMCQACEGRLDFYSGNDSYTVFLMALGGLGVVSVVGNVCPKEMKEITDACFAGDYAKARSLSFRLDPLAKALFMEVNPIPTKKALEYIGIKAGKPRLPLTEMEPQNVEKLKGVMKDLGII
ncbi:MAG: 4-hydroxy-tetrahydrodipicolinate synthase [Clostridia bacterium]|nr:4-hydroxy-tetrahydrodipicolinate synthase [Clostridia bacterium]